MGLDLYHFRANADRRGDPLTIASTIPGAAEMRQKFDWCLEIIHNLQVDWEATFAAQNLDLAHYKTGPSTVRIDPRTDIETGVFVFKRRTWFGSAPKNVVFVSLDDKPDWEAVAVRKLSRPTVFRGPLATHRVPEIVVFVEQVGYQRKSVDGKFFKEFRADELVTELARVQRIHDLTIEEARADFKQQFIDNWDDRESFVAVSW
jgi:hypothetical protein